MRCKQLKAVHVWHIHVEQGNIGREIDEFCQPFFAVACCVYLSILPLELQADGHGFHYALVVVYY